MTSRWFTGQCEISTCPIEELLGTKLRALYQRRKGRDLFDLWLGLTQGHARPDLVVQWFRRYMQASNLTVSGPEYRQNMEAKLHHPDFVHDMDDLVRSGRAFDIPSAYAVLDKMSCPCSDEAFSRPSGGKADPTLGKKTSLFIIPQTYRQHRCQSTGPIYQIMGELHHIKCYRRQRRKRGQTGSWRRDARCGVGVGCVMHRVINLMGRRGGEE